MNCAECRETLGAYAEGLLDAATDRALAQHLTECPACATEAQAQQRLQAALHGGGRAYGRVDLSTTVMQRIALARTAAPAVTRRKINMSHTYGKVSVGIAAAAVVAVLLFVPWGGKGGAQATAAETMQRAIAALSKLTAVHVQISMRTIPRDNFEIIDLNHPLVPVELWKRFGSQPMWRAENGGRTVVMDGTATIGLIQPNQGYRLPPSPTFRTSVGALMDVDQVLDAELRQAQQMGWPLELSKATGDDGRAKLVVTIEARAQGDFTNDWLKNKSICASDHRRVYRFDAETQLLENLEIWVHGPAEDVLVLRTDRITYDPPLSEELFQIELPADVVWCTTPEVLPDNEQYATLTPGEMASAFFQACSDEDWEEVVKFMSVSRIDERMKQFLGGLQVITLGEPFQSGQYPGWFVPYEIHMRNGAVRKHNLAVRNDNPAKRWVVDGGL